MTNEMENQQAFQDGFVASGLITAPAWAPWLNELNEILTTATLLIGLVLGFMRLWFLFRDRSSKT